MNNSMNTTRKTAIANYLQIIIAGLFFYSGAIILWTFFLIFQCIFICINFKKSINKKSLIFLNLNLLISTIISHILSVGLYYTIISSDGMTLLVGLYGLIVGMGIVFVLSLISIIFKRNNNNNKQDDIT